NGHVGVPETPLPGGAKHLVTGPSGSERGAFRARCQTPRNGWRRGSLRGDPADGAWDVVLERARRDGGAKRPVTSPRAEPSAGPARSLPLVAAEKPVSVLALVRDRVCLRLVLSANVPSWSLSSPFTAVVVRRRPVAC